jgi:uncharacterized protein (TIGR03083 family)
MTADALNAAYTGITAIVAPMSDHDLLRPTGCRGWTIADLVLHVTGDAQGALVAFASPTSEPADVDFVTYWHKFPGVGDPSAAAAHAQWVRRTAAAFDQPRGVLRVWSETTPAAVRAARAFDPGRRLTTQGHVFTLPDFLSVLVTEAVIHHLDLIAELPGASEPDPAAAALARATLDGLAGVGGLPAEWETREALLKGTGRAELTDADHALLGDRAKAFPLLG